MQFIGDTTWALAFMLTAARVTGLFLVAPPFSTSAVPIKLRLMMALVVAWALAPGLVGAGDTPNGLAGLAAIGCVELALGATMGYAARLVFAGAELGAFHIAHQMGISLAETIQPASGEPEASGVLRNFFRLLAVVIFLCIGGHRMLISSLMDSLRTIPPAGFAPSPDLLDTITALLAASFVLALKVAAPVLIAMLLSTLVIGALQRTLPQYNTLTVGMPVRAVVALIILAAALGGMPALLDQAMTLTITGLARHVGPGG